MSIYAVKTSHFKASRSQSGAALILMMFMIGLAVAAYTVKAFNAESMRTQQDEKTFKALADAKAALIAWSITHPNLPGQFPFPDRAGGGGYDGKSDCYTGTFQYSFLLGQLPTIGQSNPCIQPQTGLGGNWLDAQGNRLWYAVSRNLVHQYQSPISDPVINPSIVNNPTYTWMKVLDRNGNLISDRVAAVIIAPGAPLGTQNRSATAPGASEYLDSFMIGAAVYGNAGYATSDEDFIVGEDSQSVSANDTRFQKPYYFNDKLVYITIDELMDALQRRVGEQVKSSLRAYYAANGYYPYAANLDASIGKKYCVVNKLAGALPIDAQPAVPYSCTYTRTGTTSSSVSCGFDKIASISFTRATSSFTVGSTVGQCTVSSSSTTTSDRRVCTCTGAGSCANGAQKFECTANGVCTTTAVSSGGSYNLSDGVFSSIPAPCSLSCSSDRAQTIACSNTIGNSEFKYDSCSDVPLNALTSAFPVWFAVNSWQDYIYYQMTRTGGSNVFSAGPKKADAIVVTVGSPVASLPYATAKNAIQVRPSCNLNDYLDSAENTNSDNIFEATNKMRGQNYNDQVFVVSP